MQKVLLNGFNMLRCTSVCIECNNDWVIKIAHYLIFSASIFKQLYVICKSISRVMVMQFQHLISCPSLISVPALVCLALNFAPKSDEGLQIGCVNLINLYDPGCNCTRTTEVTWTEQLYENFQNAIFGGIFQIPAIG